MARGEIPGDIIGIDSNLTYSASTPYGHANAGKDLVMSLNASGNAVLGVANAGIAGVFIELRPNGKASVMIGKVLIMRQAAANGVYDRAIKSFARVQVKSMNAGTDD